MPLDNNGGGVQRTTQKLGAFFTQKQLQVAYFSFAHENHQTESYDGSVYVAKHQGSNKNPANIDDLKNCLNEFKPDVVINQVPYETEIWGMLSYYKSSNRVFLIACLRNSLFSVVNNIDSYISETPLARLQNMLPINFVRNLAQYLHKQKHRKALKGILKVHDKFILLAPPNEKELAYFIGKVDPTKVNSIPNSIPFLHKVSVDEREKMVLHVGRIEQIQKRSDLLIPIWKLVEKELTDWEFVIVGDGPYMEKLRQEVLSSGLERVKLIGKANPEAYYRKASVFMMPSAYEGFPNTILEAQSHALPSICFNSYAALEWIVKDNKDTILVEAFDARVFASKLIDMCRNQALLESMSLNAHKNAARFLIDTVGEEWLGLFKIGSAKAE